MNNQHPSRRSASLKLIALAERRLSAAAHPFRLRLLRSLELERLYTAQQLSIDSSMPLDRTIQHLKILVRYGLVDLIPIGQFDHYSLNQKGYKRIVESSSIYTDFVDWE